MKKFNQIIKILIEEDNLIEYNGEDVDVEFISYDSRNIKNKSLFFCKGVKFKDEYLDKAIENGANSYISERKINTELPYIIVKDVRKAMMQVARFFYDYPDKKLKIIAVTGTKGKTSTVTYIKNIIDTHLIKQNKKEAGIISTIYTYDGKDKFDSVLSTPEALLLYEYLYNAVESKLEYMVIEASSQAFKSYRINNCEIDIAVFLNIGNDHVSELEHPNFEDYFESKLKIFDNAKYAIINRNSDHTEEIMERIESTGIEYATYSNDKKSDLFLEDYKMEEDKLLFYVNYLDDSFEYYIKQLGVYNIENAMASILVGQKLGLDFKDIYEGLSSAVIPGRETIFESDDKKIIAFVSYAHNELSFDKTFEFIDLKYPGYRKVILFGNTGNMSISRIEGNTRSAGKNADYIYIVPDDSGDVPFDEIYEELKKYLIKYTDKFESNTLRENAIKKAFSRVEENTVLFIAGKGSEEYQKENGDLRKITSDVDVAKRLITKYNKKLKSNK